MNRNYIIGPLLLVCFGISAITAPLLTGYASDILLKTSADYSVYFPIVGNTPVGITPTSPEMDVRWLDNNQSIADGDTTPSTADGTDFGKTDVSVIHSFVIYNSGDADLNLTGDPKVVLSGCSDFSAISQPSAPVVPGGKRTYSIEFDPSSNSLCTATLRIDNDDANENPYNFTIQGSGIETPFWIEIAALHQIPASRMKDQQFLSKSDLKSLIADAFPTLIEALLESGAGGTRIYVEWDEIEPIAPIKDVPQYNWTWYDDRLRQLGATDLDIIVAIGESPSWAAEYPCSPIYPDRLDEYIRFLTDLVNRYKDRPYTIKIWELINEPDSTKAFTSSGGIGCWGYHGDDYANMLSLAYPAIKAADPEAIVLQGGLAYDWFNRESYPPGTEGNFGPFYRYFSDDVMRAGGGLYFDVLNFHYFPTFAPEWERWDPNSPDRIYEWIPAPTCGDLFDGEGDEYEAGGKDLIAKASHYHNRMETCFGLDQPLWVTEFAEKGYSDDPSSLARQARYVIMGNVRGLAAGVEKIVWYALTTPNDNYDQQLLFDDWSPKPAFYAFKTLTKELWGYEFQNNWYVIDQDDKLIVEGYIFVNHFQQEKVVAWGKGTLTFTSVNQLHIVTWDGSESWIQDGGIGDNDSTQNGRIQYQTTIEPVFITKY